MAVEMELDLGPMRVLGSRMIRDGGISRYILSLGIGDSVVEVSSSAGGKSIVIRVDGRKLVIPERDDPI